MNSFYFDKMLMLYNKNKSYVKSCKNAFKNPLFFKKNHCFPTCALFYPIVLKRKIITDCYTYTSHTLTKCQYIKTFQHIYMPFDKIQCIATLELTNIGKENMNIFKLYTLEKRQ